MKTINTQALKAFVRYIWDYKVEISFFHAESMSLAQKHDSPPPNGKIAV